jgi:two-component system nitrogen regulation response regulator NtrX
MASKGKYMKQQSRSPNILIIDDEASICESLSGVLEDEGYSVNTAPSGEEGIRVMASETIDLVFLDILMPGGMDGIETLKRIKHHTPDVEVVMVSGHGTFDLALEAGQLGARDFLGKPLSLDTVLATVERLTQRSFSDAEFERPIIGKSPPIQEILMKIRQIAPTNGRILITGESGTGKELIASAIHECSQRNDAPLIKVNCAAIPQDLIESVLFGHERGAFTGASKPHVGKFESANGGTIFLDEVGDMSLSTQARVLRVLEESEVERVGGGKTIQVDVRVISATNKNLPEEIGKGNFREDLYYRLNVVPISVPPLRERMQDIPLLIDYYLERFCRENQKLSMTVSDDALTHLNRYDWPGNVRELRNLIERLVILCLNSTIEAIHLPDEIYSRKNAVPRSSLKNARQDFESRFIVNSLETNNWNITETARTLGIERTHLHRKMRQYNIEKGK